MSFLELSMECHYWSLLRDLQEIIKTNNEIRRELSRVTKKTIWILLELLFLFHYQC